MSRATETSSLINPAPPAPRRPVRMLSHSFINSVFLAAVAVVLVTLDMSNESRVRSMEARVQDLEKAVEASAAHADSLQRIIDSVLATDTEARARELALAQRVDAATGDMERTSAYVHARLDNMTTNTDLQNDVQALRSDMETNRAFVLESLDAKEGEINTNMDAARANFEEVLNTTVERSETEMEMYKQSFRDYGDALKANLDAGFEQQKGELNRFHDEVTSLEHGLEDYISHTNAQFKVEHSIIADWIAGTFTILAFLISMRHVYGHTSHFSKPEIQRKILAILWMVPIYGFTSWLSLVVGNNAPRDVKPSLALIRDFYEAYCIYMFMALMVSILGEGDMQKCIKALPPQLDAPFICCIPSCILPCSRTRTSARKFLWECQVAVMQFVVLKPFLSLIRFTLDHFKIPTPRVWYDYYNYELYTTILLNLSVATAFYGLICFYHATQKQLVLYRPWPKFLCIKGVVFVTFWQNMTINVLLYIGYSGISNEGVAENIQNFLICVEMFVAATMHTYTFGYQEWQPGYVPPTNVADMSDNFAARDFLRDFRWVLKPGGHVLTPTPERRPRTGTQEDEMTPLLRMDRQQHGEALQESLGTNGAQMPPGDEESLSIFSLADQGGNATVDPRSLTLRSSAPEGKSEEPEEEQKAQQPVLGLMP